MSKHTPGPWTYRRREFDKHPMVQRGSEGGFVVQGRSPDRENADAYLIAAAPGMLEALEGAEKALDLAYQHVKWFPVPEHQLRQILKASEAAFNAIRLAKGEGGDD